MIDLRSDTVTKPGAEMRLFMARAEVGDDVMGEDPTVNELQERLARMLGMEAGLFCPSGTMSNQIAVNVHVPPGGEVICDRTAHVYYYEGGGIAKHSGASVALLDGDRGRFTAADVAAAICPDDIHRPVTSLVAVEDTVNRGGGAIWELAELQDISRLCLERDIPLHLDGARLFNALAETNQRPSDYGAIFDSASICLSKGLGAPVGSVLLGSRDFIRKAARVRKAMGGGMRQAGLLAAAGIWALDYNLPKLGRDNQRARELGAVLAGLPWVESVLGVQTNIAIFTLAEGLAAAGLVAKLAEAGILCLAFGPRQIRFVTHVDFGDAQLEQAAAALKGLAV